LFPMLLCYCNVLVFVSVVIVSVVIVSVVIAAVGVSVVESDLIMECTG
jgi:hypothetical protein